jgi:hypothetical protein
MELQLHRYFSLNVHITQKWIINAENEFAFSTGFPIFGYALRPSYFALNTDMEIMGTNEQEIISLHNYWAIFGDLKYRYKINTLLSLYSGIGFELSHIDFPQPRKDSLFRLYAGISFHVFLGGDPDTGPEQVLYSLWKDFNEIHALIDVRMSNNQNFDSWHDVIVRRKWLQKPARSKIKRLQR